MASQTKSKKPSGGAMMRVVFLLLMLVIVTTYLMGGLLAKYNATGSGEDDARVAKFDVKVTGDAEDVEVIAGEDPENGLYKITVKNDSEVAVRYSLKVDISAADKNGDGAPDFSDDAIEAIFSSDQGTLAVGAEAVTHTLTFQVADWNQITQTMLGSTGEVSFTFTVTVEVTQID